MSQKMKSKQTSAASSSSKHTKATKTTLPTFPSKTAAGKGTAVISPANLAPKKCTINCLVHGEMSDCYFTITINNDDTVEKLKDLIAKRAEFGFAARLLKLWIVSVHFESDRLGDSDVNIGNVLHGQRFMPPNTVGQALPEPAENHIHIIIECPKSTGKWIINIILNRKVAQLTVD